MATDFRVEFRANISFSTTDTALIAALIGKHHGYQDQEAKELKSSVQFFTIHRHAQCNKRGKAR